MKTDPRAAAGAPRVLIVENESIIALELGESLRELGYEVVGIAHNAAAAVARARELRPDVVLIDIMLEGDEDGIDAATALGEHGEIPVIFCSAYSDAGTLRRATASGAHAFITKPYRPDQVRALVETTLAKARLEREVRDSERWFSAAMRCCGDAVIATDAQAHIRFINAAAERLLGASLAEVRDCPVESVMKLVGPDGSETAPHPMREALTKPVPRVRDAGTYTLAVDGAHVPVEDSVAAILGDDDALLGAVMVLRDVSERQRLERALDASARRYTTAFEHALAGVALLRVDGCIEDANPALHTLLGHGPGSLHEQPIAHLLDAGEHEREALLRQRLLGSGNDGFEAEFRFVRRDGRPLWVLASTALLRDAEGLPSGYFMQIIDIDRRKQVEAELERLAHFDAVTGLVNRHGLQLELERSANVARRHASRFALLYIDLDHFKPVNDTLGHDAGDEVLVEVARRLLAVARTTDVVARPGGDEFVLLINDLRRAADVVPVSEKIRTAIGAPIRVRGRLFDITASIGVSVFPDDTEATSELMRHADQALYRAKASGRDATAFHQPGHAATETVRDSRPLDD